MGSNLFSRRAWTLALFCGFLIVSLQNCSKPHSHSSGTSESAAKLSSGGGTGFDGKLVYVNRANCGSGEDVQTKIVVHADGSAEKLREDCQDIPAQKLDPASLGLVEYNLDNLINMKRVFDREDSGFPLSALLCRGREPGTSGNSVWQAADVILNPTPVDPLQPYTGRLRIGWYDSTSGDLRAQASSDEMSLIKRIDPASGYPVYEGTVVISYGGETHTHKLRLDVKNPGADLVGYVKIDFSPTFGANGFRLFDSAKSERRSGFYAVADCFTQ